MSLFSSIGRSALFLLEPEKAHALSLQALKYGLVYAGARVQDPVLEQTICGIPFPNPLGMAAGYDKNAEVPQKLAEIGFGFVEVGTVTPKAQQGNTRPRLFRLVDDEAIINRMGFNNDGYNKVLLRLKQLKSSAIIGVNLGANKNSVDRIADYVLGISKFYKVARYFTINVSSPNTPGLRDLQQRDKLYALVTAVLEMRAEEAKTHDLYRPIFLKVAPDLTEADLDDIADVALNSRLDGLIISNTTISREGLSNTPYAQESGGLSGSPLFERSTTVLARLRLRVGADVPLIGVGGVNSAATAMTKIRAGADLIQLYSGLVFGGPSLPNKILRELGQMIREEGATNIRALRDADAEMWAMRKEY